MVFIDSGDEVPDSFTHIANLTACTNKFVTIMIEDKMVMDVYMKTFN